MKRNRIFTGFLGFRSFRVRAGGAEAATEVACGKRCECGDRSRSARRESWSGPRENPQLGCATEG